MIDSNNFLRHEIIGLKADVLYSSNPLFVGIKGVVINETKNMLVLKVNSEKKQLPKKDVVFGFFLKNEVFIRVDGKQLLERPADRVGKNFRRKCF